MKTEPYVSKAQALFVLPDSVKELKQRMDDDAASIDDVGDIIMTDPSLSAQLLKVANSAMYRFPRKIDTISRAVQVIGTRATYDLALAYGVSYAFKEVQGDVIDLDKFWEQSVSCGLLAKYIAEFHEHREPERFFVAGLLANVGELAVVSASPELAKRCAQFDINNTPSSLQKQELEFSYTELSSQILRFWQLPESICNPIQAINQTGVVADRDVRIIELAYNLSIDNIFSDIYPAYTNTKEEMFSRLDMELDDIENALDHTNLQCMSILSLFSPSSVILY